MTLWMMIVGVVTIVDSLLKVEGRSDVCKVDVCAMVAAEEKIVTFWMVVVGELATVYSVISDVKPNGFKVDVGEMVVLKVCWMANVDMLTLLYSLVILEDKSNTCSVDVGATVLLKE